MWKKFIQVQQNFTELFDQHAERFDNGEIYEPFHTNIFFQSEKLELGHISVIDKRDDRGMWMMHVAAFARPNYPMPIFGYDVICGKKKVTGCFHDISPTVGESDTAFAFEMATKEFTAKRKRELPDWAKQIFSNNMIAVGQPDDTECEQLVTIGTEMLDIWLNELAETSICLLQEKDHENAKAKYCENQLKNDNSRNVMIALGMDEEYVKKFKRIQFPY